MLCPACKTVELAMAERQGFEIDYCPNCRGVWLDRGELDKIIERTLQSEPTPAAAPSSSRPHESEWGRHDKQGRDAYGRERSHHEHRGSSFWRDLFD